MSIITDYGTLPYIYRLCGMGGLKHFLPTKILSLVPWALIALLIGCGSDAAQIAYVSEQDGDAEIYVIDPESGRLSAVGNTVDVETATYGNTIGATDLAAVWTDPDFDSNERAFYYVRVLEIPIPRWSTKDAVYFDVEVPEGIPLSIQDRAYTSPIWYTP